MVPPNCSTCGAQMHPHQSSDAWVCWTCGTVLQTVKAQALAAMDAVRRAVAAAGDAPAVPDVADCECGDPRRIHVMVTAGGGQTGCSNPNCGCMEFREAKSKVAAMAGSCYVCGRRDHATGACPYFPHKTPGRKP